MPSSKIKSWLKDILAFGQPQEKDYLEGIVDGDPDDPVRMKKLKLPKNIQLTVIVEFERGKEAELITCDVTMREYRRFFDNVESALETHPESVVYLHPAPIMGTEQERVGIPLPRLIRIKRADGTSVYARRSIEDLVKGDD